MEKKGRRENERNEDGDNLEEEEKEARRGIKSTRMGKEKEKAEQVRRERIGEKGGEKGGTGADFLRPSVFGVLG